jgi:hypothetical protein
MSKGGVRKRERRVPKEEVPAAQRLENFVHSRKCR